MLFRRPQLEQKAKVEAAARAAARVVVLAADLRAGRSLVSLARARVSVCLRLRVVYVG